MPVVQTNLVYDIGSHYATFEGEVTDDGGEPSLGRGFAISESTNPTYNDYSGSGSGQHTNTSYQLQPNTTYYVRAWAESAAGLVYGNEITFTTLPVGQTGEAGGTIVYDKGAFTNGWRYIEFSTTEVSASAEWGCFGTLIQGVFTDEVGSGQENTNLILSDGCNAANSAASLCDAYSFGGYSDWYLPTQQELSLSYQYNILVEESWSSMQTSASQGNYGSGAADQKTSLRKVFAVRRY